jgi:hypothetical protein
MTNFTYYIVSITNQGLIKPTTTIWISIRYIYRSLTECMISCKSNQVTVLNIISNGKYNNSQGRKFKEEITKVIKAVFFMILDIKTVIPAYNILFLSS